MSEEARDPEFLMVSEVAKLFRVDRKTVVRWANEGKLVHIRTLGGHRRYLASSVYEALGKAQRENDDG